MTDTQKLMAEKWFLTLDRLAERTGLKRSTLSRIARGYHVGEETERKVRKYLESYQGEV